jgi:LysR family transcriptional regulator, flagellar master operon regulator
MQIELIDTFLDLMETMSFNRTAERLGVTQSTVSNRIVTLEAALGRKLFSRSRAGTRPTVAGQRFLSHARDLRHEWNEARRDVSASGNAGRSMRVGIQNDLAGARMGEWVSEFRAAFPLTAFYIEVDYSNQMSADVLSGELDLAFMFTPRQVPDLHYENVGDIRYRMVSTEVERREDLTVERYILGAYSPAFVKAHRAIFPDLSATMIASGQNTAVCGMLASLGGSAFLLEESAVELVAAGRVKMVAGVDPILQPVHATVHVRHRHAHAHGRIINIVRRRLAAGA